MDSLSLTKPEKNYIRDMQDTKSSPYKNLYSDILESYYSDHFEQLTSRELDQELRKDIRVLTTTLSKLSKKDKQAFVNVFSKVIEFYIDQKIEKEIDNSFIKLINIR